MLRDTLVGLIEPMLRGAGVHCSRAGFPVLQQTSDDRPPMPGKSPPRRGGTYTNGERPFSISR
jgi:hypothetical protein